MHGSGEVFWTPEPIFGGETVFVLASGPSLTCDVLAKVKGRKTIVVNSSCLVAPWADVFFFIDNGVVDRHRGVIEQWPGLVVTMSRKAKNELPEKVKRVRGEVMAEFPAPGYGAIRQGRSSGQAAISMAVALGAATVALLGFDMRLVDGREHHHKLYAGIPRNLEIYASEFIPAFGGWCADARRAGAEIVNCTPGSALMEFPFRDLDEVLSCARS